MSAAEPSTTHASTRRRSSVTDELGGPSPGGRRRRRRPDRLLPYALILPSLVVFVGLLGYPLVKLVILSFQEYGLRQFFGRDPVSWVGLENYREILTDGTFLTIAVRTIVLTAVMVSFTMVIGMAVAQTMQRIDPVTRMILSVGLLLVWAMPQPSAVTMFRWMFNSQSGVIPELLKSLHIVDLTDNNSVFLSGTKSLIVIAIIVVWQAVPFVALTLNAGLAQVPRELYEAARVDGASAWQTFRQVTLPMLRPIIGLLVVLSLIWDLRVFNQVYLFNQGGPMQGSSTLGVYSYFRSIVGNAYAEGAAVAVTLVILALILSTYHVRRLVKSGEATT